MFDEEIQHKGYQGETMKINRDHSKKVNKAFLEGVRSDLGYGKVKWDLDSCRKGMEMGEEKGKFIKGGTVGKERGPKGMEVHEL